MISVYDPPKHDNTNRDERIHRFLKESITYHPHVRASTAYHLVSPYHRVPAFSLCSNVLPKHTLPHCLPSGCSVHFHHAPHSWVAIHIPFQSKIPMDSNLRQSFGYVRNPYYNNHVPRWRHQTKTHTIPHN